MNDVPGQASEAEGKLASEIQERSDDDQNGANHKQCSTELLHRFHDQILAGIDRDYAAAAMRRVKSFCSAMDSAPMVKASTTLRPSAYRRASSWRLRRAPWPRTFIPRTALPAAFISRRTLTTVSGSESMCAPTGLTRARSTSTQGDLAAARKASMEWQEQP